MTAEALEPTPEFARIRLFVEDDLGPQQEIALSLSQAHYLAHVMRRAGGDAIRLFNGRDGEWSAEILDIRRKEVRVRVAERLRAQDSVPDVTLAFAPIKKAPMDFLVEKATELGVARLQPVITDHTQVHNLKPERLFACAIEAAEQSWRLSVPAIEAALRLDDYLERLGGRPLVFCDERLGMAGRGGPIGQLSDASPAAGPWVLLIGPEGGFSRREQALIERQPNLVPISLGPRIVRAETAAVMVLTLWQAVRGDLMLPPA